MTENASPPTIAQLDDKGSVIKTWQLEGKRTYKIGRAQNGDIVISGTWVSRQHAMLQVEENGHFNAIDLGSSNGTFVNGSRIVTPTRLRSGDLIQIGNKTTLSFFNQEISLSPTVVDDYDEKTVAFLEKEQVSILICDIRNFTSLSEKIGDDKISDILKVWTTKTNQIVSKYHGNVDKFIGDAVMALWADKTSLRQNVHRALKCALDISLMTTQLGEAIGGLPWPLKIGAALNTGEVVLGNIGVDGNRDFTAIGDVVNVAFRLEGLTSKVKKDVLVGGEAIEQLGTAEMAVYFHTCKYLVKGKEKPIVAQGIDFEKLAEYLSIPLSK